MLTTLKTIKTLPTLPEGRTYLVVAPFAWGRDRAIATAIKNCKANFSRTYGGEWRFRVYDAPGDTTIDVFGHSYTKSDEKAVEVARYKLTATGALVLLYVTVAHELSQRIFGDRQQ